MQFRHGVAINLYKKSYTIASGMNVLEVWGRLAYISKLILTAAKATQVSKYKASSLHRRVRDKFRACWLRFLCMNQWSKVLCFISPEFNSLDFFYPWLLCIKFMTPLFKSNEIDPCFSLSWSTTEPLIIFLCKIAFGNYCSYYSSSRNSGEEFQETTQVMFFKQYSGL